MTITTTTQVLIVGAGPTGLSLAGQLLRYGIEFVIIDAKEDVTELSKAIVLHARSMEIYDQIGLAERAAENGRILHKVAFILDGKVAAAPDFSKIGDSKFSPFPYFLIYPQSETEHLLYTYLQENEREVWWQTELLELSQDEHSVRVSVRAADGETQIIEARYLVGCDGASSRVRKQLDLPFEGSTYPRLFYVVDVDMDIDADIDALLAALGKESYLLMLPLPGDKHWRFTGNMPEYDVPGKGQDFDTLIPFPQIEERLKRLMNRSFTIHKVNWQSQYKVHTRHVAQFSQGRCFLAGDAAHVHTPAGGQGMNTGIQDVYNLAWKLAWVLRGQANPSLLRTYNEERLENAKHLVKTTDQLFDVLTGQQWYTKLLRDYLLPGFAQLMTSFDPVKEITFPFLSQIGINYRKQSLSHHDGDEAFRVKAGDRMPYFLVGNKGVYDLLRNPAFHLIVFANDQHGYVELKQALARYDHAINVNLLPLSARIEEIFGVHRPFLVLLRPDNYIGLLSIELSAETISAYIDQLA